MFNAAAQCDSSCVVVKDASFIYAEYFHTDPLNMSAPHLNADTGFGQLSLGRYIMNGATDKDTKVIVGDHIEVTGNEHIYSEVKVLSKDEDFRVTISYLDEVLNDDSSTSFVVDLDLVVVAPDGKTVYRGNQSIDNTEEMFSTIERVIVNNVIQY